MTKPLTQFKWLIKIPIYLVIIWGMGFVYYVLQVPWDSKIDSHPKADAIVVLTGDSKRLETGIQLLKQKNGKRLLLSGVHESVKSTELAALAGEDITLFDCCIDLGKEAANTIGNVMEAKKWREKHAYKGLLIVTSDYHMPRAMMLFKRMDPQGVFYGAPAPSEASMAYFIREYNKYLITLLRDATHKN